VFGNSADGNLHVDSEGARHAEAFANSVKAVAQRTARKTAKHA
jgi:hypothetical protein